MIKHFFETAYISGKWQQNVLLSVTEAGVISAIETESADKGAIQHGGYVVPGMPNLHSHAFQRAMAGLGEVAGLSDDSFWSWRSVMYDFLHHITPEDFEAIADQLYLEMLKAGFTSVGEFHYLHHQPGGEPYSDRLEMSRRLASSAQKTGIHLTLLPVLYSYSGFGAQAPNTGQGRFVSQTDDFLTMVTDLKQLNWGEASVNVGVAPHSLRATSEDQLRALADIVTEDMPVHIHIAEQIKEVEDCIAWSGQRPVDWLMSHAEVTDKWCLVHATHIKPAEIQAILKTGAIAGLCPVTEANLGDGLFPVSELLSGGGTFGIGTDSNINISLAEECRLLEYGQRLQKLKRTLISDRGQSNGEKLFSEAVKGGQKALHPGQAGALQVGSPATFVCLDGDHPVLAGKKASHVLDGWIFAGSNDLVKDVYVNGKQVIEGGEHVRQEQIAARFKDVMTHLVGKL